MAMKPFYQDSQVTLYHADNREWFIANANFKVDFDLVLTDPPYNEVNRPDQGLRNLDRADADDGEVDIEWYAEQLVKASSGSVYVWCGMRQLSKWLDEFVDLGLTVRGGMWEKTNPPPLNAQYLWMSGLEAVAFARHPKAFYSGAVAPLSFRGPSQPMTNVHPTAKPLWLFEKLVRISCPSNGSVFDPWAGSGTTLEAAKLQGKTAVGIEKSGHYCELIAKRLSRGVLF